MVITVLVMNCKEIEVGLIELAAALGADRTVDFERFCAVVGVAVNLAAHFFEDSSCLSGAGEYDSSGAIGSHDFPPKNVSFQKQNCATKGPYTKEKPDPEDLHQFPHLFGPSFPVK